MTLALHGKSRRRRGILILAAFLAVIVAMAGGATLRNSDVAKAAPQTIAGTFTFSAGDSSDIPDWTDTGGSDVDGNAARLYSSGTMSRTISTVGFTDIVLAFSCRGDTGNDLSDDLAIDYSINSGGSWTSNFAVFNTSTDTSGSCTEDSFEAVTVDFGAVATVENLSTFAVRFRSVGHTDNSEDVNIDNVVVRGEPIVVNALPSLTKLTDSTTATSLKWKLVVANTGTNSIPREVDIEDQVATNVSGNVAVTWAGNGNCDDGNSFGNDINCDVPAGGTLNIFFETPKPACGVAVTNVAELFLRNSSTQIGPDASATHAAVPCVPPPPVCDANNVQACIERLVQGTPNPAGQNFCLAGDFNFVVDMSGSISAAELTSMKAGITGFVNAYNSPAPGTGDGRYAGTRFNDNAAASFTSSAYQPDGTFNTAVAGLAGTGGRTPTSLGINLGAGYADTRPAAPNMMFVVTDGSPNEPPAGASTSDPMTFVNAANSAINAANAARALGGTAAFNVKAIYVGAPDDMPWNPAGDQAFATAVMNAIGGGSSITGSFESIAGDLLNAAGCQPAVAAPGVAKAASSPSSDATKAYWDITISNPNANAESVTVTDADTTLESVSPVGACTPASGAGPWACSVAGASSTVLRVSRPLTAATFNTACTIVNTGATATWNVTGGPSQPLQVTGQPSVITVPDACTVLPTVSKQSHATNTAGGFAFWDIKIDNTQTAAQAATVTIVDGYADIVIDSETSVPAGADVCSRVGGTITCNVAANTDYTIVVKRPITNSTVPALCTGGTIDNFLTSASIGQTPLTITAGGGTANKVSYNVTDASVCGTPVITKTFSLNSSANVVAGSNVQWDVKVSNPHPSTTRTVYIKDVFAGDVKIDSIGYSGGVTCAGDPNTAAMATALNSATGLECTLPGSETVTAYVQIYVSPTPTPVVGCLPQVFNNSVQLKVGTADFGPEVAGPAITLAGNTQLCQPVTINATKIVCDTEALLPNMAGGADITSTTAATFVAASGGRCYLASGWEFEWGFNPGAVKLPGNSTADGSTSGTGWNNFDGPTNASGVATVSIPGATLGTNNSLWVREVLKPGYVPYSDASTGNGANTAEIYCGTDVENYDNYDRIDGVAFGGTYECVAWNVSVTKQINVCKLVADNGALPANEGGVFGGDIRFTTNPAQNTPFPDSGVDFTFPSVTEGAAEACTTITVPATSRIELVEGNKPGGWTDASGYPKYSVNDGAQAATSGNTTGVITAATTGKVTFFNKSVQQTSSLNILKVGVAGVNFTANLTPDGDPAGDMLFSDTDYATRTYPAGSTPTVVELARPGYVYDGYAIINSTQTDGATCARATYSAAPADQQPNADSPAIQLPDMQPNVTYTVCIRNQAVGDLTIVKVNLGGAADQGDAFAGTFTGPTNGVFTGLAASDANGQTFSVKPGVYSATETPVPAGYQYLGSRQGSGTATAPICPAFEEVGTELLLQDLALLRAIESQVADVKVELATGGNVVICLYNQPVGEVRITKIETVASAGIQAWNFNNEAPPSVDNIVGARQLTTGANPTGTQQVNSVTISNVPVANLYRLRELEGRGTCQPGTTSADYETRAAALISAGGAAPDTAAASVVGDDGISYNVVKGQITHILYVNQGCGTVLSTSTIEVTKYSDFNANFTVNAPDAPLAGWDISISGPGIVGSITQTTGVDGKTIFSGLSDGVFTITEESGAPGYVVVGSKQGAVATPGAAASVTLGLEETRSVTFYNQPRVNIQVNKAEISNANPGGAAGSGWTFTLAGCGITAQSLTTGAGGTVTFTNLPPAVGCQYTVTETQKAGWSAINAVQTTAPTAAGSTTTLSFINVRVETCVLGCVPVTPVPTTTPVTSTPTPGTPTNTPAGPTNTPVPATATPTNTTAAPASPSVINTVLGERTPGPVQTPIAPSTGSGLAGAAGSMNMFLAVVGLMVLSAGFVVLTLGRNRS